MDHDERQAEPTVAELRAEVAQRIADAPTDDPTADMLRSIVQFLDDYTAERAARSDGPKVAHYVRADASTLPTHPAGQEAAVEGMAAAHGYTVRRRGTFERIADDLNRRGVPTDTPHGKIVTEMFELFNKFERETAADRALNGDTNPYDLEPFADVHDLAEQYEQAKADDPTLFERFLDNLAEDLDLDDVKALRTAAAAVAESMGRIALEARTRGMGPDRIANETGYTASRIAQFLREERERRGDAK
ncbi:hypothetical protein [Streptomyces sp. 2-1]|uniref:hypothetical protein n=1 Tax=Streptomyces sp. 2-1 TaxID=412710 RepID=UPI003AFA5FCD